MLNDRHLNLRLILACVLWWTLAALSLVWNIYQENQNRQHLAFEAARSFFEQIRITRRWNARHGGVYVPVTDDTQPNPYLRVPNRDLRVSDTLTLTLINPAFMTRQLSEIAKEKDGIQFHITSLIPLRPENAPTPWEAATLQQFEQGLPEKGEFIVDNEQQSYHYMAPLFTEKYCLRCHADQGYREGDIRGGISVTLPKIPRISSFALVASHLAIALGGTLIIVVMGHMLAASYRELRHQAEIDPLTTIPNRRFFNDHLLLELRRRHSTPLSLILCDIDHFKTYNDHFGHPAGDQCLRLVAQCLRNHLQRSGDFCARYGGEEFVLVLPNTELSGAIILAEKIRHAILALRLEHPNSTVGNVSMSFGVATDECVNVNPELLIHQADQALYQAKHLGRNRVEVWHSPIQP